MGTTGELMLFMDLINDLYVLMLSRKWAMMEVSEESLLKELLSEVQSLFEEGAVKAIPRELTDKLSMLEGRQETYFEQWMRLETEVKSAADSADEDGGDSQEDRAAHVGQLLHVPGSSGRQGGSEGG